MSNQTPNVSVYVPKGRRRYVVVCRYKGRRYTETAGVKRSNAEKRARQLADQIDLVRSGIIRWEQVGMMLADRKTVDRHVKAFCDELAADKRSPAHVADRRQKLTALFDLGLVDRLSQLTLGAVRRALAKLEAKGLSNQTRTHYVRAVKQFGRWAKRRGRMPEDPLADLKGYNAETDRRRERRAESTENVDRLLAVTQRAGRYRPKELDGPDRAMLYRLAMATGFRAKELRSLVPASFDLGAGTVTVGAKTSKRRKRDTVALTADMVARLTPWLRGRAAGVPVFKGMPLPAARMLRRDLKRAGIPYETAAGVFDFHALRGQLATELMEADVHPKLAQEILRHADINTTMKFYTRVREGKVRAALESAERARKRGRFSDNVGQTKSEPGRLHDLAGMGGFGRKYAENMGKSSVPAARLERATSGLGNRSRYWRKWLRGSMLRRVGNGPHAQTRARFYTMGGRVRLRVPRPVNNRRAVAQRLAVLGMLAPLPPASAAEGGRP